MFSRLSLPLICVFICLLGLLLWLAVSYWSGWSGSSRELVNHGKFSNTEYQLIDESISNYPSASTPEESQSLKNIDAISLSGEIPKNIDRKKIPSQCLM